MAAPVESPSRGGIRQAFRAEARRRLLSSRGASPRQCRPTAAVRTVRRARRLEDENRPDDEAAHEEGESEHDVVEERERLLSQPKLLREMLAGVREARAQRVLFGGLHEGAAEVGKAGDEWAARRWAPLCRCSGGSAHS